MKTIYFLLLFCPFVLFGQGKAPKGFITIERNAANVKLVMSYKTPIIVKQLDTLIQLGRNYTQNDIDTALMLINHAIDLSKNNTEKDYQKQYARALSSKGVALSVSGQREESVQIMQKAMKAFESVDHQLGIASVNRFLGNHYLDDGRFKKSVDHYLTAIKIYKESTVDIRALLGPLEGLSDVYFNLGNYNKAQQYLSEAIIIADSTNLKYQESNLRVRQALIFFELGQNYKTKAEPLSINAVLHHDSMNFYYKKGLDEANLALIASQELKDKSYEARSLETIAKLKNEIGDYEGARLISLKALPIAEGMKAPKSIALNKFNLAKALFGLGLNEKAIPIAESALDLARENKLQLETISLSDLLIQLYVSRNQSKKALALLEQKNAFEKAYNKSEMSKAVTEAETKYQTANKEKQILQQTNDILELETNNTKIARQRNLVLGGGLLFGLLGFFGYQFNSLRKERNDKKAFAEALIFAQEEERKRIARDLHDSIGQSLLLIKKDMASNTEVTIQNQTMISDTLEEVRAISRDLHPLQLDKFGLTATIEDTLLKIEHSTEIFISKEIENIDQLIPAKSEIHLYRTIQEALSNVVKHAQATAAKVMITNTPDQIDISIQDNGKGFDLEMAVVASKSLGLRTMNERIEAIGGQLKFEKGEGKGTHIKINIPKSK